MSNQLQYEKSPYLLQHASNPVDWKPWCNETFEIVKKEDKPIFLSIGYSTCHWCHVMAHESFEDETVADVINRNFIAVKVDREERPDVDSVYMSACTAMTGSGGWPLTILMTPDQKPFWAGTYLPKEALISLLRRASNMWQTNREKLLSTSEDLTSFIRQEEITSSGMSERELVIKATTQLTQIFDVYYGGFGHAPKFPSPHNLIFLLRYSQLANDNSTLNIADKTLEAMYRGGIFDHIGGGFSRYSTDNKWLVPHFEKMLYDNSLLIFAYTEAFQRTQRPLYSSIVHRTIEYVLRELTHPLGGFFCGQDADSEGIEGKYYVFNKDELFSILTEKDANIFCEQYNITTQGNFEGKNIPNLILQKDIDNEPEQMENIRKRIYKYRLSRTQLHKDDKILTAWNGLMIAALARAGFVFSNSKYVNAAIQAVNFIDENLMDQNGKLLARWRDNHAAHDGKLEDYTFYIWGLLELYATTFDTQYLSKAQQLSNILIEYFFDRENGGLYPYSSASEQLIIRKKEVYDGATPSGNAVGALIISRLARLTGKKIWHDAKKIQFKYLSGTIQGYPAGHSFTMIALLEELWPTAELICTAKEIPKELISFLHEKMYPGLSVIVKTPINETELSKEAPFTAYYPIPDQGIKYYLCHNHTCSQPTDSIDNLKSVLKNIFNL